MPDGNEHDFIDARKASSRAGTTCTTNVMLKSTSWSVGMDGHIFWAARRLASHHFRTRPWYLILPHIRGHSRVLTLVQNQSYPIPRWSFPNDFRTSWRVDTFRRSITRSGAGYEDDCPDYDSWAYRQSALVVLQNVPEVWSKSVKSSKWGS